MVLSVSPCRCRPGQCAHPGCRRRPESEEHDFRRSTTPDGQTVPSDADDDYQPVAQFTFVGMEPDEQGMVERFVDGNGQSVRHLDVYRSLSHGDSVGNRAVWDDVDRQIRDAGYVEVSTGDGYREGDRALSSYWWAW